MQHAADDTLLDTLAPYAAFVLDAFEAAAFEVNLANGMLRSSPRLNALYGYPANHALRMLDCRARIHPDDQGSMEQSIERALATGEPRFQSEFRIILPDRTIRSLMSHGEVVLHAGQQSFIRGVTFDVTERRRMHSALREREEQFRLLVDMIPQIVWLTDAEGRAEFFNKRWYDYAGVPNEPTTAAEVAARSIHPEDASKVLAAFNESQRTGRGFEIEQRNRSAAGEYRWFLNRAEPYRDPQTGEITRWVGSGIDIDDRKRTEAALRESEAKYRTLFDSIDEGFCIVQLVFDAEQRPVDYRYLEVNRAFEQQTGMQGAVGRMVRELVPNLEPFWFEIYGNVALTGEPIRFIDHAESLNRWFDVYAFRIGAPEECKVAVLFTDITSRKETEDALRASDARQGFLLQLGDRLRLLTDPEEIQFEAARTLGEFLQADRVGYAEDQADDETIVVTRNYTNGVPSIEGRYRYDDYGPVLLQELRAGHTVVRPDIANDPTLTEAEKQAHAILQLGATVNVPLMKAGRLVAVLFMHYHEARDWSLDELALLEDVAARTWDAVERARSEVALRKSEGRLRRALSIETVGVLFFNLDGRILDANHAFQRISGYTLEALQNHPHWDMLTPPEFIDVTRRAERELATRGETAPYEKQFIRPDGSRWWGLFAPTRLSGSGRDSACVEFVIDITEQKQLEAIRVEAETAAVRRSNQLQRLAQAATQIQAARDITSIMRIVTEEARTLIGAHQAVASTTTGQSGAQMINQISFSEKYSAWQNYDMEPDGSGIYALVCQTNKPMRLTQAELEAHPGWRSFGSEAANHPPIRGWLAVPLVGLEGQNIGLIQLSDKEEGEFTADDEALLVQLAQMASVALENKSLYVQEQAARAEAEEASRLKDEFLATVSHELRTPLTAFLGYATLLKRRKGDDAYVSRTVEKMVHSAQAQAALIEDLLDVSRIVTGKLRIEPEPTELIDVIHAALDTVRPTVEAKGLHVVVELNPGASSVLGDANRLQQVVWNLLSNATKFTPSGGQLAVRLVRNGRNAELRISDSGQGISADFLPYVFDRFRQADSTSQRMFGGLGLGLAIVRHLVELHGGTVEATSAGLGQGATFIVRLPLSQPNDLADQANSETTAADALDARLLALNGVRVLIVDDQPTILELLEEVLVAEGAVVRRCSTAREGLNMVQTWRPDVLVSDIAMPNEDGYWLIEHLRNLAPEKGGATPAIGLTAYVRVEDRLRVLAAGFNHYVPKPVNTAELCDVILHLVSTDLDARNV